MKVQVRGPWIPPRIRDRFSSSFSDETPRPQSRGGGNVEGSRNYESPVSCLPHSMSEWASYLRSSSVFVCSLHMQVVFSCPPSANIFALACRCSVWSFVNIPTMKLWFLSDLPNLFHISEEGTSDGERLWCSERVLFIVAVAGCYLHGQGLNHQCSPKPTISPYCNLCKSHHLSDEFSKCGISPAPNTSVAQLVISLAKIAKLIWQLDFDLQYYTEAHVLRLFISAVSIHLTLDWSSSVFPFELIRHISGPWCCRTCAWSPSGPLFSVASH